MTPPGSPAADASFYPAKEIRVTGRGVPGGGVRGLWIGSAGDSKSLAFMRAHDVRLVVNCSRDLPCRFGKEVAYVRVPVNDAPDDLHEQATMLECLPKAVQAIDRTLRAGHAVLVHCYAGMQRSAAVAAAYLMWKLGYGAKQAMRRINAQKRETFYPRPSFVVALAQWERALAAAGLSPASPPRRRDASTPLLRSVTRVGGGSS